MWISLPNHGVCFGPYQNGQSPITGSNIHASQIDMLIKVGAPYFEWFLTYGTLNGLDHTGVAAHAAGRKCAAGAYINQAYMDPSNQQVDRLISMANNGECDQAIVGNEPMLPDQINMPVKTLQQFIQKAKDGITTNVPITTALISGNWRTYAEQIVPMVDVCNIHIYPWWGGIRDIPTALAALKNDWDMTVEAIHKINPNMECYLGETGWPSKGVSGATLENQVAYYNGVMEWSKSSGVDVFWFEMLDEKWKGEGGIGANWGIWGEADPGIEPALVWGKSPIPPVTL